MRECFWTLVYIFHNLLRPSGSDHPGIAILALSQQCLLQELTVQLAARREQRMENMQLKGACDCRQADLKGFKRKKTRRRKEGPRTEVNRKGGS